MTNDIEKLLAEQPLRPPTDRLDQRVRAALSGNANPGEGSASVSSNGGRLRLVAWTAAAAALVALLLTVGRFLEKRVPYHPVTAETSSGASEDVPLLHPKAVSESAPSARQPPGLRHSPSRHTPTVDQHPLPIVVRGTYSDTHRGKLIAVKGAAPIQPVFRRSVEFTCWVNPVNNTRIEHLRPTGELHLISTPVH
ncbi:MAG: hypothetical protein HN742_33485 [Lentisphaerae bacterium]|jgi:hypothetical protein|nr:hypothetical protein [Lentisphaerota bacterium]MBT4816105.1 hypothetical protein [Lentisphaerota bacterium]MBT5611286.1 hypothetical protein [Lentisphaerota bacterium]MBT7058397.1 hypothetical protein [Lentisphaerota bacterium]MBT7846832.1 hypothetical protein [Lentisphaerota bacterium]